MFPASTPTEFEVAVVGAGPAGWAAALALAQSGIETVLIAAPHKPANDKPDTRTAALFASSIQFLRNLGAWDHLEPACAPLSIIRLIDDTGGLFKAPQLSFSAHELGLDAFGFNVPQGALLEALRQCGQDRRGLTVIESRGVTSLEAGETSVALKLFEGESLKTKLVAASDGRNSTCRKAVGIKTQTKSYEQMALACTFSHSRAHNDASNEFHRLAGPCTTVPLPGCNSSLVWVERPDVAKRLAEMPEEEFCRTLEKRLHGLLGSIGTVSARVLFPLSSLIATNLAKDRVALVGETGHVLPPIGAQGLNLSLRDAAVLAEILSDEKRKHSNTRNDLGSFETQQMYHNTRISDVTRTARGVDLLNRSLISQALPVQLLRGFGLHVLKASSPVRQFLMRQGLGPSTRPPRLMQAAENLKTASTDAYGNMQYPQVP